MPPRTHRDWDRPPTYLALFAAGALLLLIAMVASSLATAP